MPPQSRTSTRRSTETFQDRAEQLALLVAVAAPVRVDELGLDRVEVHADAAAEHQVQVLERDGRQVRAVQRRESGVRRVERAVVPDAPQVGVEVKVADGPLVGRRRLVGCGWSGGRH